MAGLRPAELCLLVRLPDGLCKSAKRVPSPVSVVELKERLELVIGLPACGFLLSHPGSREDVLSDGLILSSENCADNTLLTVVLPDAVQRLYQTAAASASLRVPEPCIPPQLDNDHQFTLLFLASHLGCATVCQHLIREDPSLVTRCTGFGNSALHAACSQDRVGVTCLLLAAGGCMEIPNKDGKTCLSVALDHEALACARALRQSKRKLQRETIDRSFYSDSPTNSVEETLSQPQLTSDSTLLLHQTVKPDRVEPIKVPADTPSRNTTSQRGNSTTNQKQQIKKTAARKQSKPVVHQNIHNKIRALSARQRTQYNYRFYAQEGHDSNQRNVRLCRQHESANLRCQSAGVERDSTRRFKLTRPQYLQYIKSSTGIIEEDYFADIFPDAQNDEVSSASEEEGRGEHEELKKRQKRILKKRLRESGLLGSDASDTDSEQEQLRAVVNQRAYRKWESRKREQEKSEQAKQLLKARPLSEKRLQQQCITPLLMVGDTWSTQPAQEVKNSRVSAYQRARSAPVEKLSENPSLKHQDIDPLTYHMWLETKSRSPPGALQTDAEQPRRPQCKLTKNIEHQDWLEAANAKLKKEGERRKKERKYRVQFENWVKELKEEVDTYGYWKKNKEKQLVREGYERKQKQQRLEQRWRDEELKRQELSSQIYDSWVMKKETGSLRREESRLLKERQRLEDLHQH